MRSDTAFFSAADISRRFLAGLASDLLSDSTPRPRRRGRWQVARTAARSAAPNGRVYPRPRSPAVRR